MEVSTPSTRSPVPMSFLKRKPICAPKASSAAGRLPFGHGDHEEHDHAVPLDEPVCSNLGIRSSALGYNFAFNVDRGAQER